jgi:hypothetical protein
VIAGGAVSGAACCTFRVFAEPAAPAETPIFDGQTLKNWKVTDFAGHGDVKVENGQIILEAGNDITGVSYTGELPRTDYEVSLQAMRLAGSDFFCGLTFPVGAVCVTYVVGGWGGSVVGISSINGDDASENETTQFKKLDSNKWYRVKARVTAKKLETWLDDDRMASVDLEGKRLAMRPGEIELSEPFGIATYRTRAALKDIKLRKL